ncbi:MAG: CTP pyrophosphohydrolase [Syntrophorhabdus sp. PtaU1.Bin153]|nr:MAG: CTP pyrophosphohydrolase [Syntrophorhabdus sp. PtaU1.Bin153]
MTNPDYMPVTAAVMSKEGKVLIAKRKRGHMGYKWEFPGGKAEAGETLEGCLQRELREELGIEVKVGALISSQKHVINCQAAIAFYVYEVFYLSGDFALTDHEEVRWVAVEDLEKYDFPEPDQVVVKVLRAIAQVSPVSSATASVCQKASG